MFTNTHYICILTFTLSHYIGSCDNDEVFAPSSREDFDGVDLRETPMAQWWGIIVMLTVGWWPGYLLFNATGPAKYRGKDVSHLSPTAAFFDNKDYWYVLVYLCGMC